MKPESALLWWWLQILNKRRYEFLRQQYGTLDSALEDMNLELLCELGLREGTAEDVLLRKEQFDAARYLDTMHKLGIGLMCLDDEVYPAALREISDAPVFLSYRGDRTLLQQPLIAVVGTREMSSYGHRVVRHFVPAFIHAQMVTVSGLARGVDAAVATESMRVQGKTIAVLGNGLPAIHPKMNEDLADQIIREGGLLLSELPLETSPEKYTFPARNRIIAGLSLATVVCEAPLRSGSVITAELALDYNRDVYAVPGPIFDPQYAGCHMLIGNGHARLAAHPEEILIGVGVVASPHKPTSTYTPITPLETAVYRVLSTMPQRIDDLVEKSGCSVTDVGVTLILLELAGAARALPEGQWVRA